MAAEHLTVEDNDGTRLLTLANPPSNHLSLAMRQSLVAALTGVAPPGLRIVITGQGANFSSSLPLDPDPALPGLAAVCTMVETHPVPVIAALHGLVIGPGAELALAARARVAAPGTRIAFPEIALGLCPEGGTTRRLAARVGMAAALRLLLTGRAVPAEEALALGLIDLIAEDAVHSARRMALPPVIRSLPATDPLTVAEARRAQARPLSASGRIIACVEAAALLPPEAHLSFEAVARDDLEAGPEAAALRSVARAERRAAAAAPEAARIKPQALGRIALHGTGADLVTLARMALARGLAVAWHHPDASARTANLAALDRAELAELRAGRLTAAARADGRGRLLEGGSAAVHVHAGPRASDGRPGTDDAVHLVLGGGEAGLGLGLSPSAACCEVSAPPGVRPGEVATAVGMMRRLGLQPVLVGLRPILGHGVATAGRSALAALAAAGVPKQQIARALDTFGARMPEDLPEDLPNSEADRRDLPAGEILARWLGAMVNEGLRLLDQGIARRPGDIDLVLVAGHGFPRWQGGPMHQADRRGLMALRADLRSWAGEDPLWSPAPLLDRLIREGVRLGVLDARG